MGEVSQLDKQHLELIRANVRDVIRRAAAELDAPTAVILDIAPQDYLGAAEFFRLGTIRTLDIDPAAGADYTGDLCEHNAAVADGTFDVVICTEVLEHTRQPFHATTEIHRILKPGGCVVATTPFNFRIHGPLPDCWRFTVHGLRELFKAFDPVHIREYPGVDERFLMPVQYEVRAYKARGERVG